MLLIHGGDHIINEVKVTSSSPKKVLHLVKGWYTEPRLQLPFFFKGKHSCNAVNPGVSNRTLGDRT